MLAQEIGEGAIDNVLISPALHRWWGAVTVAAVLVTVILVTRHVGRRESVSTPTRWTFAVAQVLLIVQALLGIKLLDQGQGIFQLYIHYIGGLIPLGSFLAGGWVARGDTPRSARVLLGLLCVGFASALMAFVIGRAYVTQGI